MELQTLANRPVGSWGGYLLAEAIKFCKSDIIVFAVGCNRKNDDTIKLVMDTHFGGYETKEL